MLTHGPDRRSGGFERDVILSMLFISPVVIFSLILSSAPVLSDSGEVPQNTIRIATYNINGGYDADGVFQLGLISRTIEAGLADIVVLQEVDSNFLQVYTVNLGNEIGVSERKKMAANQSRHSYCSFSCYLQHPREAESQQ